MFSVREVIGEAAGLDGKDLEKTYKGRAGGVVTIRSGMGELIHKLATTPVVSDSGEYQPGSIV